MRYFFFLGIQPSILFWIVIALILAGCATGERCELIDYLYRCG